MADLPALLPSPDPLAPYLAETEQYLRHNKSPNTVKAYRSDWAAFERFCAERQLPSLPASPGTLAAYAAHAVRWLKARTVERHLTSISQSHQLAGYPNPAEDKLVRTVMAGIRRVKGTGQSGKEPLSPELLRKMFAGGAGDLRKSRDRALLLVGFSGAFRRSELVALRHEDVRVGPEGVTITIPHSKTDQEGAGQTVGIPFGSHLESCPVRALTTWLEQSAIRGGPLFPAIGRWGREVTPKAICDHQAGQNYQAPGRPSRSRPGSIFGALAPLRPGDCSGPRRRLRAFHHGPDPGTAHFNKFASIFAAAACSKTMPRHEVDSESVSLFCIGASSPPPSV